MANRDDIRVLWAALKPEGYGDTWTPEPWDTYWSRVQHLIPNFPAVAAQQWLWRHYTDATDFSWLVLPELVFSSENWSVAQILEQIHGWPNHRLVEKWSDYLRTSPDADTDWLVNQMRTVGTWPQPPMIIKNTRERRRPDGLKLAVPYQLMEGHHRIGFLRALAETLDATESEHEVLVIDVPDTAVLDYWPLNERASL